MLNDVQVKEMEIFSKEIGLELQQNALFCQKEPEPNMRSFIRTFGYGIPYDLFLSKPCLVIFTEKEVIIKKITKYAFFKSLKAPNLEKGLIKIPKAEIEDFTVLQTTKSERYLFFSYQEKDYYLYFSIAEYPGNFDFSGKNFEYLTANRFYGLLQSKKEKNNYKILRP